ncbi:MAG TPA: TAT-variant-translocated molybdopterin oxidoreductase [Stenomitos sp.]
MTMSWDAIRNRLSDVQGARYWQSLEELCDEPGFQELVAREFPAHAAFWESPLTRRRFLQLMGASLALAGLTACSLRTAEKLVPYVRDPEGVTPGKPQFFASAMVRDGHATGLLFESHLGRPTKIEGNPDHPMSLGATDAFMQAAVLDLWDPDRSQTVVTRGRVSTWEAFESELLRQRQQWQAAQGSGLRLLTEETTSPTLVRQVEALLRQYPRARWYRHDPVDRSALLAGAEEAFGQALVPHYRFDRADVVLTLDSDVLADEPASLRYAREFAARRRPEGPMNRLYAVEAAATLTGAMADHRRPMRSLDVGVWAGKLLARLQDGLPAADPWLEAVARDLLAHPGRSLVVVGYSQPALVHAIGHALNARLGNLGQTVTFTAPAPPPATAPFADLVAEMHRGEVQSLFILGANPVWTAAPELAFDAALRRVPFSAHLGLYQDETSALCTWHLPEAHFLEAWSDARAYDGTASILQPGIAPLYEGRSTHEVLAMALGSPTRSGLELVRETWRGAHPGTDFEAFWTGALEKGLVPGTSLPPVVPTPRGTPVAPPQAPAGLELVLRPDPTIWDGRFANNAWLQELPKPLSKLTWDNAALMSPVAAERLGLSNGDVVELRVGERSITAPVWIAPGQADDSVVLTLGYGRKVGRVAHGQGSNAYVLRSAGAPWIQPGLVLRKTDRTYPLATTQRHHRMAGEPLVQVSTLQAIAATGSMPTEAPPSLYPEVAYPGHKWAMAIDLNACTGCSACVVACQAENNIPVVGKEQVMREREMHWLRIDRYYEGPLDAPRTYFQPVPCMHCENAPCEVVCPTAATVHDDEGLNAMVYNRCVGTRYCSNNCPYKVRRFNFFQFSDWTTESLKGMRNPEVTVRSRGVMEKCTYCVQRIQAAKGDEAATGRPIRDGEVRTACQAACPTRAIVFGDLNDPASEVAALKAGPRHYALLGDLDTRPRTTYLSRVRNPNPALEEA